MMSTFHITQFEENPVADSVCTELFATSFKISDKQGASLKSGPGRKRNKTRKKSLRKDDGTENKHYKNSQANCLETNQNCKTPLKARSSKDLKVVVHVRDVQGKHLKQRKVQKEENGNEGRRVVENKDNVNYNEFTEKQKAQKQKTDSIPSSPKTISNLIRFKHKRKKDLGKTEHTQKGNVPVATASKKLQKPLKLRMMEKLQGARFRYINEHIYSNDSKEAHNLFANDPESFRIYHEGFRQQVNKWPLNPLDVIISSVQNMPRTFIVADFGCGDAKLAKSVAQKVYSFDLVAINQHVTTCDMAHVPLASNTVEVVVFCLSLMGTNVKDYIVEANRVLKRGGTLKIAEVASRFEDISQFIEGLRRYNFRNTWKDLTQNLFYFLDFQKEANIKSRKKLPKINLHPCLYKKR